MEVLSPHTVVIYATITTIQNKYSEALQVKILADLVNHLFPTSNSQPKKDILLSSSAVSQEEIDFSDVSLYEFDETKKLVQHVKNAVKLIEEKGESAFSELRTDPWYTNSSYIFVAGLDGMGFVNPPAPELEGQNVLHLKNSWGTQMIKQYLDELTLHGKKAVWVHYLGINPRSGQEDWKSSFVMKAASPSGKGYAVGSGIYNMKMERVLVGEDIKDTCELIEKEGLGAVRQLMTDKYFKDTFQIFTQ